MQRGVWLALTGMLLASCQQNPRDRESNAAESVAGAPDGGGAAAAGQASSAEPALSLADTSRVCRAAIADLNGHSPSIMKTVREDPDAIRVRYVRPSDGKTWTSDCRLDGDRIVWRMVDAFGPGSGEGRWRDDPADEVLTFRMKGSEVTIITTFAGEAPSSATFRIDG